MPVPHPKTFGLQANLYLRNESISKKLNIYLRNKIYSREIKSQVFS